MHEPRLITVPGRQLKDLRCMDYGFAPLYSLAPQTVHKSTDPPNYMQALRESIREVGVIEPLMVIRYATYALPTLANGHHRAVLAHELNIPTKVNVVDCACPASELDFLGVCSRFPKSTP